jgi:hypothetical protein
MDTFGALGFVTLLTLPALVMFRLARLADDECRSFLTAWAEEGGMAILRCHPWWSVPQIEGPLMYVVYRLSAVDRQGRLRTGWASVAVKVKAGDRIARGVKIRWTWVRAIPRLVGPTPRSAGHPLWDPWLDR